MSNMTEIPIDPLSIAYSIFGVAAMCTNWLILAILFTDKQLLGQSPLVFGFACSHFICGVNIAVAGIVRIVERRIINESMSVWDCVKLIYPVAYPLAFQSSALLLCLVGVERLLAVAAPHWFRKWMDSKRMWRLVWISFASVIISVSVGSFSATYLPPVTLSCVQTNVFGKEYTAFGRAASAIGGTVAIVLTVTALILGTKRIGKLPILSGEAGRMRKQIQLTRSMMSVVLVDFCLVVIPNSISFWATITGMALPSFLGGPQSNIAYSINATVAVFSYLAFNRQFRKAAIKLCSLRKIGLNHVTIAKHATTLVQNQGHKF